MDITALSKFFSQYKKRFLTGIPEVDRNQELKFHHTFMVHLAALHLAQAENFSLQETVLLQQAAICHDISRFEQFCRFRTFNDAVSFDHGERSFELIRELGLFEDLPEDEQTIIFNAVRYHNKRDVPPSLSGAEKKILCAVRDADKVDIMRVLLEHLRNPENPDVVYQLDPDPVISPDVESCILSGKPPLHSTLRTSLDFMASKFAWVFDLNYSWSAQVFLKQNFMAEIRSFLPESPVLDKMLQLAEDTLHRKSLRN